MIKKWKISDLIRNLRALKKEEGDLLVELSSDEEGNSFNPIGSVTNNNGEEIGPFEVLNDIKTGEKTCVIYPL